MRFQGSLTKTGETKMDINRVWILLLEVQDDPSTIIGAYSSFEKAEADRIRWSKGQCNTFREYTIVSTNII